MPIASENGAPSGFLLLLEDASGADGSGPVYFHGMWTRDVRMTQLFRVIERVAKSDSTVLVRGETGSGKELVAHAIHELSARRGGPFRAINCAALPPHLLESELFGHARGAFTGAVRDTTGHMQLAHRGTLFLDEVAELPLELQAKLLRVLETRTVIPVGGREPIPVDVRIVSATHRSLRAEVDGGRFRADLMHRLRVIPVFLPPLRARPGDIELLIEKLVARMNEQSARKIERVSPAALAVLVRHSWPGNVRELQNALSYAFVIGDGPVLRSSDLPPELLDPSIDPAAGAEVSSGAATAPTLDSEAGRILDVLQRTGGNRDRAAKMLGLSRVTLWRKMRALGLSPERART
jgi:transcriptional regulator with PAS, ATPase and Fis domain